MNNHVTVLIGIERDSQGRQIDPATRATAMHDLRDLAVRTFGGYTLSHAEGGWTNHEGKLIIEAAVRLDIFTDKPERTAQDFAAQAARICGQGCVVLDVRPSMYTFVAATGASLV